MPPSHLASRTVLALLIVAAAVLLAVTNVDPGGWDTMSEQARTIWSALRSTVQGTTGPTAAAG